MARRIPVVLTLQAADYINTARTVKSETAAVDREIDELGRSVDAIDRDFSEMAITNAVVARSVDDLGDEARAAARQIDEMGDQSRGTAAALTLLDARIAATRLSVRELGLEFARTGDKLDGQALGRERSLLRKLERLREELSAIEQVATSAVDTAASAGGGGRGIGRIGLRNPYILGGLAATAAVLAPAIGAIVSGAVAGSVTGGGILGGIIAASKDTRVRSAWSNFADDLTAEAFGGGAFVQPLIEGIGILKSEFATLGIDETLSKAASSVPILAQGIADLAQNTMPGLNKVFDQSETFTRVFADGLGDVGFALSDFLGSLMDSEGTIEGLAYGFKLLSGAIIFTGNVLEFLGDTFHAMAAFSAELTGVVEDFIGWLPIGWIPGVEDAVRGMNDSMEETVAVGWGAASAVGSFAHGVRIAAEVTRDLGSESRTAAEELESLLGVVDQLIPGAFSLEEAQDAAANAVARLAEQLEQQREAGVEGAGSLTGNTQAARDNRDAVRDLVDMYGGLMVKAAEAGESTDALKQELKDQLIQMGFNEAEVQRYVDKLDLIPASKITELTVEAAQALQAIQETERELQRMQKSYTVTIQYKAIDAYLAGNIPHGFVQGFAAGGTTPAYEPFKVGEHGAEYMFASREHFVATAQQWNGAAGGGGGGGSVELVIRSGGSQMDDLLVQVLSKAVQVAGGDGAVLGIRTVSG